MSLPASLKDFTTTHLIQWSTSIKNENGDLIFEDMECDCKQTFETCNIVGSQLANCKTKPDVEELISKAGKTYLKKPLFDAINRQREIEASATLTNGKADVEDEEKEMQKLKEYLAKQKIKRDAEAASSLATATDNDGAIHNGTGDNIKIVVIVGNKPETLRQRFNFDDTVGDVTRVTMDQLGLAIDKGDTSGNKKRLVFGYKSKILEESRTLRELKLKGDNQLNHNFIATYTVIGGAEAIDNENKEKAIVLSLDANSDTRERLPDFDKEKHIKPSRKPDCIMGYNSKKELRVEMPCGHVFASQTIYRLVKMNAQNISKSEVACPMEECNKVWDFNVIIAAGDLDHKESEYYQYIFDKRALLRTGNFRDCPGCGTLVNKPDTLAMIRVRCEQPQCKNRKDFCWSCGKDWQGGGFTLCGNEGCPTMEINNALQTCRMITPSYVSNKSQCPEFRACPRCLVIVGWYSNCKHMKCWACNQEFCFICLALKTDKGWPCGMATAECGVAPRQKLK